MESLGKSFPAGKDFCLNSGNKKRNHEIFGVFQNLEKKFSKYISFQKIFFFEKIYFKKFHIRFWKTPKISFFHFHFP